MTANTVLIDVQKFLTTSQQWMNETLLNQSVLLQIAICIPLLFCASIFSRRVKKHLESHIQTGRRKKWYNTILSILHNLTFPFMGILFLGIYVLVAQASGLDSHIGKALVNILLAWIIISFASTFLSEHYLMKWIKILVLAAVALNIFGLLDHVIHVLDNLAFDLKDSRISLFSLLKGVVILVVLLWATSALSALVEKRINKAKDLTPSLKVLFSKFTKIFLFTMAVVVGLNAIGLDLTAFTVFSGAVGVGLGFGLQKVVSNFISGIILLTDRSIKPGDVIAIGETYGWVNSLGARYVSVITRDGKEHLIPNESLITEKVENWSFTNNQVRIRIPIGVSYDTDIHNAIKLILKAAKSTPRVLKDPDPRCLLRGFGDNSVDLELRIWIDDPVNGMGNIQSDVLLNVWDTFKENKIEIPFPQRDLHLKSADKAVLKALS